MCERVLPHSQHASSSPGPPPPIRHAFCDDFAGDAVGVGVGDLTLARARGEDVTGDLQTLHTTTHRESKQKKNKKTAKRMSEETWKK